MKIVPVILSADSGSGLGPLLRHNLPKQFLPLTGTKGLLQETVLRTRDRARFQPPIVVASAEHRFIVAEELREAGVNDATLVLEPALRNTAVAIMAAAVIAVQTDPDCLILVQSADHAISDEAGFGGVVELAASAACDGAFVLFGLPWDGPGTGHAYLRGGSAVNGGACRVVDAFVDDPDIPRRDRRRRHFRNSGIMVAAARALIEEMEARAPEVAAAARASVAGARKDLDFLRLDGEALADSPAISMERAVLEKSGRAAVIPIAFNCTPVGAWSTLPGLAENDEDGDVKTGGSIVEDSRGSHAGGEGQLVAALGMDNLVVVATTDAVLIADLGKADALTTIVQRLRASSHGAASPDRRVERPWGWYECIEAGERFQVKHITVNPGGKLSLQKHYHRAEHWVVVNGTAEVELNNNRSLLSENESLYIPLGATHRLSNPGKVLLHLIEVQSGAYLGEDDIVRLEDEYARA